MEGITIRRLGPADLDLLCAVPDGLFDEPIRRAEADAFLADPMNEIVLAYAGDLAVSMATATILRHPDKPISMFINEVGTREGYLRRGYARAVCERMIAIGRERGCEGIWLGTETDNDEALALYRKMGGEEVPGVYFGWDDAF